MGPRRIIEVLDQTHNPDALLIEVVRQADMLGRWPLVEADVRRALKLRSELALKIAAAADELVQSLTPPA